MKIIDRFLENMDRSIMERDPVEEARAEQVGPTLIFLLVTAGLLTSMELRWFVVSWLALGFIALAARVWFLADQRKGSNFFLRFLAGELAVLLRSGDFVWYLSFWPVSLIASTIFFLAGWRITSFAERLERELSSLYLQGGKYHGIHGDTAWQFANSDIAALQATGASAVRAIEEMPATVERKSKFALACGSILAFLASPFGVVQSRAQEKPRDFIFGSTVLGIEPDFTLSLARLGARGQRGSFQYLAEVEFAGTPKLRIASMRRALNPVVGVKAGQFSTPQLQIAPPPAKSPFAHDFAHANEISPLARGLGIDIAIGSIKSEVMMSRERLRTRVMANMSASLGKFGALVVGDAFRGFTKAGVEITWSDSSFESHAGIMGTNERAPSIWVTGAYTITDGLRALARYERSPWLKRKEQWTFGFSYLIETILLRGSWASDEKDVRIQLAYTF
ncbi:MAG: hypothetical protein Q7S84_04035 [bacterium]|nr:hypothetical protein [bacterium]